MHILTLHFDRVAQIYVLDELFTRTWSLPSKKQQGLTQERSSFCGYDPKSPTINPCRFQKQFLIRSVPR